MISYLFKLLVTYFIRTLQDSSINQDHNPKGKEVFMFKYNTM